MKKNEIKWLSCLQGFSMLTVVIGHVYDQNAWHYGFIEKYFQDFIYIFHMPLFMFISGYLFNLTKINNSKPYYLVLKEKVIRLLIPYFSLNILTFVLKFLFPKLMNRTVSFSFEQLKQAFITLDNMPLYEMWFINILFFMMLLYPVYCKIIKNYLLSILFSIITVIIFFFPFNCTFIFDFYKICKYIVFFWLGILTYQYKDIIKKLNNTIIFCFVIVLFLLQYLAYLYYPNIFISFISPIICITFFVQLFYKIGARNPNLFGTFRNYTYQIFLMGIFIQVFVRIIIFHVFNRNIVTTILLYICSIILGLYIPVLISKIILRINFKPINMIFGLPYKDTERIK